MSALRFYIHSSDELNTIITTLDEERVSYTIHEIILTPAQQGTIEECGAETEI